MKTGLKRLAHGEGGIALDAEKRAKAIDRLAGVALALGPVIFMLMITGALLILMGQNPVDYYSYILQRGILSPSGLQTAFTRMGPLLLIAASLIVAFRAGIWNLGGDGQFLLGAVFAAAVGPHLSAYISDWAVLVIALLVGTAAGAIWSLVPALLRAYHGINEIITSLMMTFLGVSAANVLVKLAFADPRTTLPQTRTLALDDRLPRLFGTTISSGILIGIIAVLIVHFVMAKTSAGLRLRIVGANARAAAHIGLPVSWLTVVVFAVSSGLAGLAGALNVVGVDGNVRADWNPAYALTIVPLVFLARFNGFATISLVFLFSVFTVGSESAARKLDVPGEFTLVAMAILLVLLGVAEALGQRRRNNKGIW
jgi:ABC-type uncharacterized transport system permease subunit